MKRTILNNDLKKTVVVVSLIVVFAAIALNQVFAQADSARFGAENKLLYKKDAKPTEIDHCKSLVKHYENQ